MFKVLLYKSQILLIRLRNWQPNLPLSGYAQDVTFFVMMGLPIATLAYIFHFAYGDHIEVAAELQRRVDLGGRRIIKKYEARGESVVGQQAVAEVTLNRVKSKRFPDDVCSVVHEKRGDSIRKRYVGAFSWTEFDVLKRPKGTPWIRATEVAVAAYDKREAEAVPGALFYHADYISPSWSRTKKLVAKIGSHNFYE
jgi:hypothetical protein